MYPLNNKTQTSNPALLQQHTKHTTILQLFDEKYTPINISTHLLTRNPRVAVRRRSEDQVVEDGGVGRDSDASADHHRDLELVPVLVAAAEGTFQTDLRARRGRTK